MKDKNIVDQNRNNFHHQSASICDPRMEMKFDYNKIQQYLQTLISSRAKDNKVEEGVQEEVLEGAVKKESFKMKLVNSQVGQDHNNSASELKNDDDSFMSFIDDQQQ